MRKSALSLIGIITLCSIFTFIGTGCIKLPFATSSASASSAEENTMPPRPASPQNPSLIVTGDYEGRGRDNDPCPALIERTSNTKYPYILTVPSVEEKCYQREDTLICPDDLAQDRPRYILVKQVSPTEIEISDHGVTLLWSGTASGDAELCIGRLRKISD